MLPHGRLVAFLVTLTVSAAWLVLPVYSGGSVTTRPGGQKVVTEGLRTGLVQVNGPWVILLLALPACVTLLPLFFPRLRVSAAIALLTFSLLGAASVGLFYIPSAVLLLLPERTGLGRDPGGLSLPATAGDKDEHSKC